MLYVGVCHYYATGEGCTIYVASGDEESIRESIPEYFHPGLVILTPSDWLKAATGDCGDEYHQSYAKIFRTNLPELWHQIEERALGGGCHLEFFMRHHYNYA